MALAGGVLMWGEAALAARKPAPPPEPAGGDLSIEKVSDMLMNLGGPILANLGFSGCMGAAAGMALKKLGQFVAVAVGLVFLLVQGLAYTGFITVQWTKVHGVVLDVLDVNKDGKVDSADFKPLLNQGLAALSQGVPSVGGFLAGFLFAIKSL